MLCDLGAKMNGICSDITTTFPINGRFSQKEKEIYDVVLKSQLESMARIRPDVTMKEVSTLSFRKIVEGLRDLGLLVGEVDELMEKKVAHTFYPHSLGHYIGFKTHDVGLQMDIDNVKNKDVPDLPEILKKYEPVNVAMLEAGMVTTVEPGVYFIPHLINKAKANEETKQYYNFPKIEEYMDVGGVRIEDCVLVTESGFECLTKCPRTTTEIEKCMAGLPWEA